MYGACLSSNANSCDPCADETNIGLGIPLIHSMKVMSYHGSNQWGASTIESHFEILYETNGAYKSTNILFDCN